MKFVKAYLLAVRDELPKGNVLGVGVSTYWRGEVGYPEGEPVVVMYVTEESPRVFEIAGVKVIKIKTKPFKILVARTGRVRPILGGISISNYRCKMTGTLGGFVKDKVTGEVLGISNNHCIALQWGTERSGRKDDPVISPGCVFGGKYPSDVVGHLVRWSDVPTMSEGVAVLDVALFKPTVEYRLEVLGIGVPEYAVDVSVGDEVVKSGISTGITYGVVEAVDVTVKVLGFGRAVFQKTVVVRGKPPIAIEGDSGSLTFIKNTRKVCGVLFAGNGEDRALLNPAKLVESMMRITFNVTGVKEVKPKTVVEEGLEKVVTPIEKVVRAVAQALATSTFEFFIGVTSNLVARGVEELTRIGRRRKKE